MPTNIEVKARIIDRLPLIARAQSIADFPRVDIDQDDTFFECVAGRLKLRTVGANEGQLIFYQRANAQRPTSSFYVATVTTDPDRLRETLTLAYGAIGRVRKHRILFLAGRTRIHLDRVDGLGDFLELEVGLREGDDPDAAAIEANDVLSALGVDSRHLVAEAYIDLLSEVR